MIIDILGLYDCGFYKLEPVTWTIQDSQFSEYIVEIRSLGDYKECNAGGDYFYTSTYSTSSNSFLWIAPAYET